MPPASRVETTDESSYSNLIANAINDMHGLKERIIDVTRMVNEIGDKHLGSQPETDGEAAVAAQPDGQAFFLLRQMGLMSAAIGTLERRVERLLIL